MGVILNDLTLISHKFSTGIEIIPVGDVHLGAIEHCESEWESFCHSVTDNPNIKIVLVGDLMNNATRSSVSNVFEDTLRPREQKKRMVEYLDPLRYQILCAVSGNHEARSGKDADNDPMYDIMTKLDLEDLYRVNTAFMKISCGVSPNGRDYSTYTFCVTHGAGGGIYTGAAVNRNERFGNIVDGLDCLIVGHTHKGTVSKPSKIVIDTQNNLVTVKHYTVVSSVSWLNYGGYAMRKMLLPAQCADPQRIILDGKRRKRLEVRW